MLGRTRERSPVVRGVGILGVIVVAIALGCGSLVAAAADSDGTALEPTPEVTTTTSPEVITPTSPDPVSNGSEEAAIDPDPGVAGPDVAAAVNDNGSGGNPPDSASPPDSAGVQSSPDPSHKVTICHATPPDTAEQGYNSIEVDVAAAGGQMSGHQDQHNADIIPPWSYGGTDFAGKNWDATGRAIYDNGCVVPSPATPDPGTLLVKKVVVGTPPAGATFTVGVKCSQNGSAVDQDVGFTAAGGEKAFPGVPAGSQCSATEKQADSGGATTVDVTADVTIVSNETSTITVTNTFEALAEHKVTICHATPPDTAAQGYNSIEVDVAAAGGQMSGHQDQHNADIIPPWSYGGTDFAGKNWDGAGQGIFYAGCQVKDDGGVEVEKVVTGAGAPDPASFTVNLTCKFSSNPAFLDENKLFSYSGGVVTPADWYKDVPAGSTCTANETGKGGADHVAYTPESGSVAIASDEEAKITVTNTFDAVSPDIGQVTVTKVIGTGPKPADGTTFTVLVTCTTGSYVEKHTLVFTYPSLGSQTFDVAYEDESDTYCKVDETGKGGALSTSYAPASANDAGLKLNEADDAARATVTNSYSEVAGLAVFRESPPAKLIRAELPFTGSNTGGLLAAALVLIGVGALIGVPAWRQRRRPGESLTT